MKIKVCGMRNAGNIAELQKLDIDFMGFIFWSKSPRYVQQIPSRAGLIPDLPSLDGERIKKSETHDKRILTVGVFVDDMPQNIVTRVYNYHLDYVQLHGSESAVMIDNLRRTLIPDIAPNIKIIKALSIKDKSDLEKWHEYDGHVDMFLFDTKCKCAGGSGEQFDWSVLEAYDGNIPFLLAGGIGPDDAERIKNFHHPMCLGIDLNSRFETEPGMKDIQKLKLFMAQLQN
ncbi:MAG: phosphoribosylanthranilate isomerase [Prevotella sp.]|nr:phosphoribosylanthranilate isomerase [Prevotella sp.]